jgi:hypothetical protein
VAPGLSAADSRSALRASNEDSVLGRCVRLDPRLDDRFRETYQFRYYIIVAAARREA